MITGVTSGRAGTMAAEVEVIDMTDVQPRVLFQDIKPYAVPASLDDLHGPAHGLLELPSNVYWGPVSTVDLGVPGGITKAYQAVLREGRVSDLVDLLNRDVLIRSWDDLMLPDRVRDLWETHFPELTAG